MREENHKFRIMLGEGGLGKRLKTFKLWAAKMLIIMKKVCVFTFHSIVSGFQLHTQHEKVVKYKATSVFDQLVCVPISTCVCVCVPTIRLIGDIDISLLVLRLGFVTC